MCVNNRGLEGYVTVGKIYQYYFDKSQDRDIWIVEFDEGSRGYCCGKNTWDEPIQPRFIKLDK